MSSEEVILKVLCEINNRLNDIAITLQTLGWVCNAKTDDTRMEWLTKLSKLSLEQPQKYAELEVQKA